MNIVFQVKCPYCGFMNTRNADVSKYHSTELTTCDLDEGGCDESFVFVLEFEVLTNVSVFKLEKVNP